MSRIKLFDFNTIYKESLAFVEKHVCFSVWVKPGLFGMNKRKICRTVLNPLLPSINVILIYELQTNSKKVLKYSNFLEYKNGRHVLNMSGKTWEYFIPILYKPSLFSTIHKTRGSILIECSLQGVPWEKIFSHCFGPFTVSNPSIGCGKSALSFARDHIDDHNTIIIVNKINTGLESITILCHKKNIHRIYDIAAKTCNLTIGTEREFEITENSLQEHNTANSVDTKSRAAD